MKNQQIGRMRKCRAAPDRHVHDTVTRCDGGSDFVTVALSGRAQIIMPHVFCQAHCRTDPRRIIGFLDNQEQLDFTGDHDMAKRPITVEKLRGLQTRTRFFVFCQRVLMLAMGLSVGLLVVAMAMPQKRVLDDLEVALDEASQRERAIHDEKRNYEAELRALREDPEFLEIHARDRLDFHRDGERILKFRE
jgi:cell division protein FtsB